VKIVLAILLTTLTLPAFAGYNANFRGTISAVLTYPGSTLILIRVSNQPTSHPECTSFDYLAIDPAISNESRQLVMSRLLLAFTTGENINIGYDKSGDCIGGRIRVHRVG